METLIFFFHILYFCTIKANRQATMDNIHPLMKLREPIFEELEGASPYHTFGDAKPFPSWTCTLPNHIKAEIETYKPLVNILLETILVRKYKGRLYQSLSNFVNTFPHRVPGSKEMDMSIDYVRNWMNSLEMRNVHEQPVEAMAWERGFENATLRFPKVFRLNIRSMAQSVPTQVKGITARVVVVRSFIEAFRRVEEVKGSILLFNSHTGEAQRHEIFGAIVAAKVGALAVLCRSHSPVLPHRTVVYSEDKLVARIPVATIQREHADLVDNLVRESNRVTLHLTIVGNRDWKFMSKNLIGDYPGRERTNEYVMFMSHSDVVYEGIGATDNGLGIVLGMEMISLFKDLNIRPRRTIRHGIFTGEENGYFGIKKWVQENQNILPQLIATTEADMGCLQATGLIVSGSNEAACVAYEIQKLFQNETQARKLSKFSNLSTNMIVLKELGIPNFSLNGDVRNKFWEVIHTELDTMKILNSDNLDRCLVVVATTTFVVADLRYSLPRNILKP